MDREQLISEFRTVHKKFVDYGMSAADYQDALDKFKVGCGSLKHEYDKGGGCIWCGSYKRRRWWERKLSGMVSCP